MNLGVAGSSPVGRPILAIEDEGPVDTALTNEPAIASMPFGRRRVGSVSVQRCVSLDWDSAAGLAGGMAGNGAVVDSRTPPF